ncbi:MAG: DUF2155 domain-containing protein [Deltaproteobacteria bacterium]|nr:MAG: DUF2155 domain-containing protein [Deltaproteobacteria bacterium]
MNLRRHVKNEKGGTMKKFALLTVALLVFALALPACKKKEQAPPPPMPGQGMPGQPGGMPSMGGGPEKKVVVPEGVKGNWKAVKIEVEYKEKKSKKVFSIPLNSEFKVPDSDLLVKIGEFLPHFTMAADSITSTSNNPENPAAQMEVLQNQKEIFHGWLFAKFPTVHPFQNDKYGITLVEGVKK